MKRIIILAILLAIVSVSLFSTVEDNPNQNHGWGVNVTGNTIRVNGALYTGILDIYFLHSNGEQYRVRNIQVTHGQFSRFVAGGVALNSNSTGIELQPSGRKTTRPTEPSVNFNHNFTDGDGSGGRYPSCFNYR